MVRYLLALPFLLIMALGACQPAQHNLENSTVSISTVMLRDTIPTALLAQLNAKETHGIKVKAVDGHETRYFEYQADTRNVLTVMSLLPFTRNNRINDTTCRAMMRPFSTTLRSTLPALESEASFFFWPINASDYTYYECVKGKDRHTILINRYSRQVLHRVES